MVAALQKTKLFMPPLRERWVFRARLIDRLDALLTPGCRLALISAPPGAGKTTLIVQWLAQRRIPAGWLSLDERDNLLPRFFAYLIEALQGVVPGAGQSAQPLLDLPGVHVGELVALLTNDLIDSPGPFVLVLDDFHILTNPLLHQAVDLLIDALPAQARLVLLSREDPGIPLARRRASGQLVEIRHSDLSFTSTETASFFEKTIGLCLRPEQVHLLDTRIEGWIAGLQMASIAMQAPAAGDAPQVHDAQPHTERFLQDFSASQRFIVDYLMEEVLARQPEELQTFLLQTSILERMQPDLCAAVTGKTRRQCQTLLEQITKANLFVIPLGVVDDAPGMGPWYRYHHLFGRLLLGRLQSESPELAVELMLRASNWFEANGDPRLAVEYALRAQDPQRAADLMDRYRTERWHTVDLEFFQLVNRLPLEVIAKRPSLCLQSAWLCVLFGQNTRILPLVEAAEHALDNSVQPETVDDATSRAFARTLRAYITDLQNQPVALEESLALAYAAVPETNPGMRNSVAVVIGMIHFMEGDFATAIQYYEDALALDQRLEGTNAVPITITRICSVLQAQGRLHASMLRLREAEQYLRPRGIRRFYIAGSLFERMAEIHLEWNNLEAAEADLQEGLRLLADWPVPTARVLALALMGRLCVASGKLGEAAEALRQADQTAQQIGLHPYVLDALEHARLDVQIATGNHADLTAWVKENEHYRDLPLLFRYERRQVQLCRAWLALGQHNQAAALLERLLQAAQAHGSQIHILVLLAAAYHQQVGRALPLLDRVLRLAEPEGYLRIFLEAGSGLVAALRHWLAQRSAAGDEHLRRYAREILSIAQADQPPASQAALPVSLTLREMEVLRLIAEGLTNQQIAERLVISVRTVKKHIENIHGKLDAQNRTQAVRRAQALGLLNS